MWFDLALICWLWGGLARLQERVAVAGLDLDLFEGQVTGLLGHNGDCSGIIFSEGYECCKYHCLTAARPILLMTVSMSVVDVW